MSVCFSAGLFDLDVLMLLALVNLTFDVLMHLALVSLTFDVLMHLALVIVTCLCLLLFFFFFSSLFLLVGICTSAEHYMPVL